MKTDYLKFVQWSEPDGEVTVREIVFKNCQQRAVFRRGHFAAPVFLAKRRLHLHSVQRRAVILNSFRNERHSPIMLTHLTFAARYPPPDHTLHAHTALASLSQRARFAPRRCPTHTAGAAVSCLRGSVSPALAVMGFHPPLSAPPSRTDVANCSITRWTP